MVLLFATGCASASAGGLSGERPIAVLADPFQSVLAGQSATFDASDSYDPDDPAPAFPHGIEEFRWTLLSLPAGSVATVDHWTDGLGTIAADVAGDYAGELVVVDADGRESEPAAFGVTADPIDPEMEGLLVRLTWESDGRDLDLHVVLNGAAYKDPLLDCHYANAAPDWGEPGDVGDCRLEQDFTEGPGPELARVRLPQQASYGVFAHVFSDDGFGASSPTVLIARDGVLVGESAISGLLNGHVWSVGTIAYADSGSAPTFTPDGATFPEPGY